MKGTGLSEPVMSAVFSCHRQGLGLWKAKRKDEHRKTTTRAFLWEICILSTSVITIWLMPLLGGREHVLTTAKQFRMLSFKKKKWGKTKARQLEMQLKASSKIKNKLILSSFPSFFVSIYLSERLSSLYSTFGRLLSAYSLAGQCITARMSILSANKHWHTLI